MKNNIVNMLKNDTSKRLYKTFTLGLLTTCSALIIASASVAAERDVIDDAIKGKTLYDTTDGSTKDIGYRYFAWIKDTDSGNLVFKEVSTAEESDIQVAYQNVYGVEGDVAQYFKWDIDAATGNATLDNGDAGGFDLVHYGTSLSRENGEVNGAFNGDFVGQSDASSSGNVYGGAIYNKGGQIDSINGDFIGNHIESSANSAFGGAIRNNSGTQSPNIGVINGNFIGNYASSVKNSYGGAVNSNAGTIGAINGSFISNYVLGVNEVHGGAIRNLNQTIISIDGDFIGNYASYRGSGNDLSGTSSVSGGAIHNYSENTGAPSVIESITGNFIGNYVEGSSSVIGGAIYNQAGQTASSAGSNNGRLNGTSIIGSIIGNFIGNHSIATTVNGGNGFASAGAIRNFGGEIGLIKGDFIGNYVMGYRNVYAGAIRNNPNEADQHGVTPQIATIEKIEGNFIGNYISGNNTIHGGAMVNTAVINEMDSDFIGNHATGVYDVVGGAIRSTNGEIKNIKGNFIGNYASVSGAASSSRPGAYGGAINNENATIGTITGNFIDNYAEALADNEAKGGAIYNNYIASDTTDLSVAKFENLLGNFENNYAVGGTYGMGGAIFNTGLLSNISGNFEGNYADGNSAGLGGAIYNSGKIESISGSFTNNHASTQGGAIYTTTSLDIVADGKDIEFTGNYVGSLSDENYQAIYVEGASADSNGELEDEVENDAPSTVQSEVPTITLQATQGGSITFNDKIEGDNGYNIHLTGGDVSSRIVLNNQVNGADVVLDNVTLNIGLTDAAALNSDVFANSTLTVTSGVVNTVDGSYGTYNFKQLISNGGLYSIDVSLDEGVAKNDVLNVGTDSSGVITLSNVVINKFGVWSEKDQKYVEGAAANAENEKEYIFRIVEGTNNVKLAFADNIRTVDQASANMTSDDILASGFELYVSDTENRSSDEYDSVKVIGWRDNLAAWAELEDADDKTFTINEGDTQVLTRNIVGLEGENFVIEGKSNNVLNLQGHNLLSDIASEQEVSLTNIQLVNSTEIDNKGALNLKDVTLEDSLIINNDNEMSISGNMDINNTITSVSGGSLTIQEANTDIIGVVENQNVVNTDSITNLYNFNGFKHNALLMNSGEFNVFDLGLSILELTRLTINGGDINIDSVNAHLIDEKMGRIAADEYGNDLRLVADDNGTINLKDITIVSDDKGLVTDILFADAPVANNVRLGIDSATGPVFNYSVSYITKGDKGDGYVRFERGDYNSSIPVTGVEELAAGYATMLQTLEYAFEHADRYSTLSHNGKLGKLCFPDCATYDGELPSYYNAYGARGMWIRPYGASEHVSLKHGPKVNADIYGTLIGMDSNLIRLGGGMLTASTVYLGYNGTKQKYDGNRTKQRGGVIGATQTLYVGKLYTALTASGGLSSADTNTMFGKDHFNLKMGGIASKTGYNIDFADGKYIIQPNMMASYTLINAGNYTTASTARIKSRTMDVLQLHPHVKLINNLEDGWQTYLLGGMVYNIGKTDIRANGFDLPGLSFKPYAEYGGGVQVIWDDSITAYGQVVLHSGGRSGVVGSAGLRWNF